MTIIEKILAFHSSSEVLKPGQIADIDIDVRAARDFGGANVVKHIRDHNLQIDDPGKTMFTFDCNPTGSDQKYAVNQHLCRQYARENGIAVHDIDAGIGTHIMIDLGYAAPGSTAVSTDSHANILGAVGAFGQGMGDMDIAAAWNRGKVWFKVPPSCKMIFHGDLNNEITAKDFILNLLARFGANTLLGYSIELYGKCVERMTLDERITISSMATEMGAIIILFPPSEEVITYCRKVSGRDFIPVYADQNAEYDKFFEIDAGTFVQMVSRPGEPHDAVDISTVAGTRVDSVFIGSCTNGRMTDMRASAGVLKGRKVAPGVVLKIVPATDQIWDQCLKEGLIRVFKESGALVSNAGCAGCAAGQVGQNGQGEVTISTGNRNFPGKQGKGSVFLASPETAAASAIAGYITPRQNIPSSPQGIMTGREKQKDKTSPAIEKKSTKSRPVSVTGRIWLIGRDNIDTDMIYHNKYLAITEIKEMGQYAFDNLKGFEDFAKKAGQGDIIIAGKNFGSGSSRQQAVDCFVALGIAAIIAESFGAIYERNAINAGFPLLTCTSLGEIDLQDGDKVSVDFMTGLITNLRNKLTAKGEPFSDVQHEIYQRGSLLG